MLRLMSVGEKKSSPPSSIPATGILKGGAGKKVLPGGVHPYGCDERDHVAFNEMVSRSTRLGHLWSVESMLHDVRMEQRVDKFFGFLEASREVERPDLARRDLDESLCVREIDVRLLSEPLIFVIIQWIPWTRGGNEDCRALEFFDARPGLHASRRFDRNDKMESILIRKGFIHQPKQRLERFAFELLVHFVPEESESGVDLFKEPTHGGAVDGIGESLWTMILVRGHDPRLINVGFRSIQNGLPESDMPACRHIKRSAENRDINFIAMNGVQICASNHLEERPSDRVCRIRFLFFAEFEQAREEVSGFHNAIVIRERAHEFVEFSFNITEPFFIRCFTEVRLKGDVCDFSDFTHRHICVD
jgi:hypothetical protein